MDTRLLYTIALVIATVVGSFYYYSGKSKKLDATNRQNLNSTAHNIQITQTTETGQLYAKSHIDQMIQSADNDRAEANQIQGILFEKSQPSTTFNADKGIATNDYVNVELLGNVVVSKLAAAKSPSMTFTTDQLTGNTETNQIKTDRPVLVQSPQAQFTSQGLIGDLNIGQYEFFTIRGKYDPSKP